MDESIRRSQEISEKNLEVPTHEDYERLYEENERLKQEVASHAREYCEYTSFVKEKLGCLQEHISITIDDIEQMETKQ